MPASRSTRWRRRSPPAASPFAFASGYGPSGLPEGFRDRPLLGKPFGSEALVALVRHTYPDQELGRGVGLNGLVVAVAAAVARLECIDRPATV